MGSEPRTNLDPRLAKLLADVEGRWGRGALVRLGDALRSEPKVIPTGFPALDDALGIGGLPCGRISEIFGPDSSGKHALAAHLVVQCQREEGVAAYIDLGQRLDPEQMRAVGVDFQSLLVVSPMDHLHGLEIAVRLARSEGIRLIILDLQRAWNGDAGKGPASRVPRPAVGATPSQDSGFKAQHLAPSPPNSELRTRPSVLGLALRRLVSAVDVNGIAFVFLTEAAKAPRTEGAAGDKPPPYAWTRHRTGGTPALPTAPGTRLSVLSPQSSKGGQALRFFASVRLGVERREWICRGRDVVGCRSAVHVAKNKLAPPMRWAAVDLLFYRFPPLAPALQLCCPGSGVTGVPLPEEVRYARA
jgi:recombination protein RecA